MKEQLIKYSKKKGFSSKVIGKSSEAEYSAIKDIFYYLWLCELQKWIRDEHKMHITIYSKSQESWMFRITKVGQSLEEGVYGEDFESYEQALEEGLYQALQLIK